MDNISLEQIKMECKKSRNKKRKKNTKWFSKLLLVVILTLLTLIFLKANPKLKSSFYKLVYEENISFVTINEWYEKYFGSSIPFKDFFRKDTTVFQETLHYKNASLYKDGCLLEVEEHYLVPTLKNGMVVFIGDKENYLNTVILEQVDGVEVWYSNVQKLNVKMYDYIEAGTYLGETIDTKLYLTFKKDGKALDYQEYIS